MLKIFCYECRRLLGGKAFLGMSAVTLWTADQTLRGQIIWGVADTAPFSAWSFGYYLAALLPYISAAGLLLLTGFFTKSARQTEALTQATPMKAWQYALVRCGAVALGQALLSVCVAGMGIAFFVKLFGAVPMQGFGQVALLTLLPLPVLALGLGTVLGRRGVALLYALAAAMFLLPSLFSLVAALGAPGVAGMSGTFNVAAMWEPTGLAFFRDFPAALGVLDPPLQIPPTVWVSRLVLLLMGAGVLALSARSKKLQKTR